MKKWCFFLILLLPVPGHTQAPEDLMVEFLRAPTFIAITDEKPEFSWVVPPAINSQTAWQIQVATEKGLLLTGQPDLWDAGKIIDRKSVNVEYGGTPLPSHSKCFWRVRIWNAGNQATEFSEIQQFKTGDLSPCGNASNSFIITYKPPEKLIKKTNGHYYIDFGRDAFGTLMLKIIPVQKETIIIRLGENSNGEYSVDKNPDGNIRYQKVKLEVVPGQSEYTVKLPPDKRNTGPRAVHLPDSIGVIMPFRYCEIENASFPIEKENVRQRIVHYYWEDDQSYFTSSDTILNQIWELCRYSIKATSFCGLYIDGDRERIPYEADALINQLGHYCTDREYTLARRTNDYFIDHPTWPTEWILYTPFLFYYDYLYTGNTEAIRQHWKKLKYKTLTTLAREDGLLDTSPENQTDELILQLGFDDPKTRIKDIVDWPPAQKDTGWKLATEEGERDGFEFKKINTVVNAIYYQALKFMAEMAGAIGEKEDAAFYEEQAKKVHMAFNRVLLDPSRGYYIDGEGSQHSTLHANMFPLAFGLVPEKHKPAVIKFIKSRGMACSVYGAQFLLDGLYREGEADYALQLMTATHDRSWWNMIDVGSTITMEAWDMKYKPNSDWNHAWGAAPANIIPRWLWGIQPTAAGFEKCIIKPQLSNLSHAEIKVPTIRGIIFAKYDRMKKSHIFHINLPGNMEATFDGSLIDFIKMKFQGKPIERVKTKKIVLETGENVIELIF